MWTGGLASRRGIEWSSSKLGGCRQWRWALGLMLTWSGFQTDIATLAWNGPRRQGQPSLFQGTTAAGAAQEVQSRHLSTSSSQLQGARATILDNRRKERPFRYARAAFFFLAREDIKKKFWLHLFSRP